MKTFLYPFLLSYSFSGIAQELTVEDLLNLSLEELMQVKVQTASKVAEKIGEIPASVVLMTRKDIQRYGYTSLAEILQHISGMYQLDYYAPGSPTYGIRGYVSTSASSRNIIILINGVSQVFDYDASYVLPATPVPVEAIDRVEIVRGPLSVVYGSGAFFGVINLITNEVPKRQGVASRVSVQGGNHDTFRWFGRTSYVHANGHLLLNTSTYQTAGLNIPYRELESKPMGLEGDLTTGGRLEHEEDYLELSGRYQNISFSLTHNQSAKEGFFSRPTIWEGSVRRVDTTHLQIGYQQVLSDQLSWNGKLTYANAEIKLTHDGETANFWGMQNIKATAYEGELNMLWKPQPTFDLSSGLYYRQAPKVSTDLDIPSNKSSTVHQATQRLQDGEELATWAWSSQLNYYPNPRWKGVVGLRLEQSLGYSAFAEQGYNASEYQRFTPHYDDQKIIVIPRLAAIYTPNEKHIFKWLYGKAINTPSFGQNTTARVNPGLPKLEEEEIETWEFDYLTYLSPRYLLSLNLFRNHLQNLLTRTTLVTASGQYLNILGNAGKWVTNGMELSLLAQPSERLQLELGVTYQHTEDHQSPDLDVSYSPPWLGQFKLAYQWSPAVNVGLTSYYVSEMEPYFDPSLKNADGSLGNRVGPASEDYLIFNANLRFDNWLTKGTFANVHVSNLFDQEFRHPTFTINRWIDKGALGGDRSVMVTVGYEF